MGKRNQVKQAYQEPGWESLANAIVEQAANDYRRSFDREKNYRIKRSKKYKVVDRDEVLSFFHSPWYEMLTNVDPDFIIEKLNEELEDKGLKKRAI
jgi:hypothetical protein